MKNCFLLIIILFIQSCLSENSSIEDYERKIIKIKEQKIFDSSTKNFDGEQEPGWPEPNDDILGIDSNSNGVRDDIEIYINRNESNNFLRKALKQLDKYYNYSLKATSENDEKSLNYSQKKIHEAIQCLTFLETVIGTNSDRLTNDILNFHYNTEKRIKIHKLKSKMLGGYIGGTGVPLTDGHKLCEFDIDTNLRNALKK